jgi:hypothetical protein
VSIEPSGWGTKVILTASLPVTEPEPEPELPAEPDPPVRRGLFARLFGRERRLAASTDQPVWVAGAPEPEPEPEQPTETDPTQAILEDALEALGSAHHRPFSRG